MSKLSRRDFVGKAGVVGAGALAAACVPAARAGGAPEPAASHRKAVPDGAVVLFQGDSITDAGRNRGNKEANVASALGSGYPLLLASALLAAYPEHGLHVFNRGTSGNKVPDAAARWDTDAIALAPTLVSVLLGVNDFWRTRDSGYTGTAADYEQQFGELLEGTKARLSGVTLVVLEPFVLKTGSVDAAWWPGFDERRAAAARVASRIGATYVTLQREFEAAAERGGGPAYWLADGVHPTPAGHGLIAERWRAVAGW